MLFGNQLTEDHTLSEAFGISEIVGDCACTTRDMFLWSGPFLTPHPRPQCIAARVLPTFPTPRSHMLFLSLLGRSPHGSHALYTNLSFPISPMLTGAIYGSGREDK